MPKQLLVILGSPRLNSNSEILADQIVKGFCEVNQNIEVVRISDLHIDPCVGCLKCNKSGGCQNNDDDWADFLSRFKAATHVVIATPVYFRHLPGSLKILLDRFRSQIHIRMTENGLIHIPRWQMRKQFAFIFSLGDRKQNDTLAAQQMLTFLMKLFGANDEDIHVITATGLAIRRQISLPQDRLANLYDKLGLPAKLVQPDFEFNQHLLQQVYDLGKEWSLQ